MSRHQDETTNVDADLALGRELRSRCWVQGNGWDRITVAASGTNARPRQRFRRRGSRRRGRLDVDCDVEHKARTDDDQWEAGY